MGRDKGRLIYHDLPQEEYLHKMLSGRLSKVYLSKKEHGTNQIPVITDRYDIESPLNGILSAFDTQPHVAWLVLGCDMPLIEQGDINQILKARDNDKIATCFLSDDGKPHPLFAIYEPKAYPLLKVFSKNKISPRQFLMQNDIKTVFPSNNHLKGANTPEEMLAIVQKMNKDKG